jgi:tricorn protease-like protein
MEIVGVGGGGRGRRDGEVGFDNRGKFQCFAIYNSQSRASRVTVFGLSGVWRGATTVQGWDRRDQLVVAAGAHERGLSFWFQ